MVAAARVRMRCLARMPEIVAGVALSAIQGSRESRRRTAACHVRCAGWELTQSRRVVVRGFAPPEAP